MQLTSPITFRNLPLESHDLLRGRCLQNLLDLVSINSSSHNKEGVFQAQRWVARQLDEMGFQTQYFPHPEGKYAPLLVGRLFSGKRKTVSLVMHTDTVLDSHFFKESGLRVEGKNLVGPGVIDNKGGVIVAIEGLRHFLTDCRANMNFQVVCVPNEEVGSEGFHTHLRDLGLMSDFILGFEPGLESGDIIESRHGNRWYDISIRGIEAHSGRCQGEELNAAHEWAYKLVKILEIKNQLKEIKINVGSLRSSKDKFNVVCGDVNVKLDMRFSCNEVRDLAHREIVKVLNSSQILNKKEQVASTEFTIVDDCPAFKSPIVARKFFDLYTKIYFEKAKVKITSRHAGGASDVNYMSHANCVSMDGLGPLGGKMHTKEEFLFLPSLRHRAFSLSQFLKAINNPNLITWR